MLKTKFSLLRLSIKASFVLLPLLLLGCGDEWVDVSGVIPSSGDTTSMPTSIKVVFSHRCENAVDPCWYDGDSTNYFVSGTCDVTPYVTGVTGIYSHVVTLSSSTCQTGQNFTLWVHKENIKRVTTDGLPHYGYDFSRFRYIKAASASGSGSDSGSGSTSTTKKLFVSATGTTGNIGGVTAADTICNADANRPDTTKTYKAVITDGTNRKACTTADCANGGATENLDWVLAASTEYYRADETLIGTTTAAGIFSFPLTAAVGSAATQYWTGMDTNWNSVGDCTNWATANAGNSGTTGIDNATGNTSIDLNYQTCDNTKQLLCAQQ